MSACCTYISHPYVGVLNSFSIAESSTCIAMSYEIMNVEDNTVQLFCVPVILFLCFYSKSTCARILLLLCSPGDHRNVRLHFSASKLQPLISVEILCCKSCYVLWILQRWILTLIWQGRSTVDLTCMAVMVHW